MAEEYGDYHVGEGVPFKGPLLRHGRDAMMRLAQERGWTLAKAVRRAVRAYAFHLACHPELRIPAPPPEEAKPPFTGRYDTDIEADVAIGVEDVAQRFGVRRHVVVAAALAWYAEAA